MQAKNKLLPQEFWDLRRRARNSRRSLQQHAKKQQRQQATKRWLLLVYLWMCFRRMTLVHESIFDITGRQSSALCASRKAAAQHPDELSPEQVAQHAAGVKAAKWVWRA